MNLRPDDQWDPNLIKDELEILNRHFKTAQKEKYSQATAQFYFNIAAQHEKKDEGNYFSQRALKRIEAFIRRKLQEHYGPWANAWIIDDRKGVGVGYNIDQIYKTDKGNLYGHPITYAKGILATSHAIDRFEERYPQHELLTAFLKTKHNITATAFDRFMTLINYVQGYYIDNTSDPDKDEQESGTYYLWCFPGVEAKFAGGIYVLEKIETLFIIKTFLPEQAVQNLTPLNTWKRDIPSQEFNGLRNWLLAL